MRAFSVIFNHRKYLTDLRGVPYWERTNSRRHTQKSPLYAGLFVCCACPVEYYRSTGAQSRSKSNDSDPFDFYLAATSSAASASCADNEPSSLSSLIGATNGAKHNGQPMTWSFGPRFSAWRRFSISAKNCSSVMDTRLPRSINMLVTERFPEPCQFLGSGTFGLVSVLFM